MNGRYSYVSRARGLAYKRISGHALMNRMVPTTEKAVCKCGRESLEKLSNNKRRVWHRAHLDNVVFMQSNPGDVSAVILRKTGLSYRQLDYWARKGYIPSKGRGSGKAREWDEDAVFVAIEMFRLVTVGFTPEAASSLARKIVSEPSASDSYELENGFLIKLGPQ